MREAKIIKFKDRTPDPNYEPPLLPGRGIWSESVENPALTLSRVVIPPGARNQRHYHIYTEAGMYVVKGPVIMFYGPDHEMEEVIAEAGDFFFIPIGLVYYISSNNKTIVDAFFLIG